MDLTNIAVSVVAGVFAGGGLMQFFNMRTNKRKLNAEAENAEADTFKKELENTMTMAKFWRDSSELLKNELIEGSRVISELVLERDRFRINLGIAKTVIAEATCETLDCVKNAVSKL